MTVKSSSRALVTFVAFVAMGLSCSGSGAGCSALTPFPPGTHYAGPKSDNGASVRLSASGLNAINSNWRALTEAFAPGQKLEVPFACTPNRVSVLGDILIGDQGARGCTDTSCGRMDGKCDSKDVPAKVVATITNFSLVPKPPSSLEANVELSLDTDTIYVDTVDRSYAACIFLGWVGCSIDLDTARHAPNRNALKAAIRFSVDDKFDRLLSFSMTGLTGTEVCSGTPTTACLDPDDIDLDGANLCGTYCDVADWGPIKEFVLDQISGPLQTQIQAAIAKQTCQACETNADCPKTTDGTNAASTCDTATKTCKLGSACAPRFLGTEGTVAVGSFLSGFGAPASGAMELTLAAGAKAVVDQGLSFGTRVGSRPQAVASCVPPQSMPALVEVPFPDFEAEAVAGSPFHAGVALSSSFLNQAFWAAHQSGAFCLSIGSSNTEQLRTGLLSAVLPSLGALANRDGKDAPMRVVLRPARPPTVTVGKGTFDPTTKKPIEPLLLIALPDLAIDFYASIDDREARLFTLTADVTMPLSLIFEGCDKVTPALGDLKMLVANVRTSNSELLAEDPQQLANLVPTFVSFAEPAFASALKGFALPPLGGFKLKVNEAKGLSQIGSSGAYDHLGLYAQLLPADSSCAVIAPRVQARLERLDLPTPQDLAALAQRAVAAPTVHLSVELQGLPGTAEYSVKVDDGLWSTFSLADAGQLAVSHPRLLIEGPHLVSVRARRSEDPTAISTATEVPVVVDLAAPSVALTLDREADRIKVTVFEAVSSERELTYAYAVGEEPPNAFGAARPIGLSAVEASGGVTVLVKDAAGRVGTAAWRRPLSAAQSRATEPASDAPQTPAQGCSTAALLWPAAALLVLARRRR